MASQPSCFIGLLPNDLQSLIFSYFAFRPRLFVVSMVCKRWRTLIVASIATMTFTFPENLDAAIAAFPSLTDVSIETDHLTHARPLALSSSLKKLRIARSRERLTFASSSPLPLLSQLELFTSPGNIAGVFSFLAPQVSTVTSLDLCFIPYTGRGDDAAATEFLTDSEFLQLSAISAHLLHLV